MDHFLIHFLPFNVEAVTDVMVLGFPVVTIRERFYSTNGIGLIAGYFTMKSLIGLIVNT